MRPEVVFVCAALILGTGAAEAACRPDALGTSRTIVVDPAAHARIGTMQYAETLPLADKEVVLTFDDGPLPPHTTRVLDTLRAECVKATFFLVGRMAHSFPDLVRRIHAEGHTIGSHSQNHPLAFHKMDATGVQQEVETGIAAITAALGDSGPPAPFFRIPGLLRGEAAETYLADRHLMVWSADFPADDWTRISADEVMRRALERLERKGKGVLLLHDIQSSTAAALPELLRELKRRGYRVVHVEPAKPDNPPTPTDPDAWRLRPSAPAIAWPRVPNPALIRTARADLPVPSPQSFGLFYPYGPKIDALPADLEADFTAFYIPTEVAATVFEAWHATPLRTVETHARTRHARPRPAAARVQAAAAQPRP